MKNAMKLLIGSLVLASALTACGKKGGGSASAPAGAAAIPGIAGTAGFVMVNTWSGNVVVTNLAKYSEFLGKNGLCYNLECTYISGFFRLSVQTVSEEMPNAVNFSITPRFGGGFAGRRLRTQGDGYMNANGNGFQVTYNRFSYAGGLGGGLGGGYGFPRPTPYGYPVTQPVNTTAPSQSTLQIILTYADATSTVADAIVIYEGVQIANGRLLGRAPLVSSGYGYGVGVGAGAGAPAGSNILPYKTSSK